MGRSRLLWLALAVAVAAVAFVLGWRLGRDDQAAAPPTGSAAPLPSSQEVQLRLDAGGLTLVPDGGLRLPPLPSLDAQELSPKAEPEVDRGR